MLILFKLGDSDMVKDLGALRGTGVLALCVAMCVAMSGSPAAAASPPLLPATESSVRCWNNAAQDAGSAADPCAPALHPSGSFFTPPPGNSVTASKTPGYDITIAVRSGLTMSPYGPYADGPGDGGAVAFTKFHVAVQLLKDLPADFDFDNAKIPLVVTSSTQFSFQASPLNGLTAAGPINGGLNLADAAFAAGLAEIQADIFEDAIPGSLTGLFTRDLIEQGELTVDIGDIYESYAPGDRLSTILGFTDLRFAGTTLIEQTLIQPYSATTISQVEIPFLESAFSKEGDYFIVEGLKGAACMIDIRDENASCSLHFDPVVTFDQDAFDRLLGPKSFDLTSYFALAASSSAPTGSVPEPASWAMMIGGFALIGAAMRRRKIALVD
jgi:hypothetical protein